ncbi:MAG: lysophospholipid acyltransferase family protein [Anaerolineales bacterium]|jgi:1-acyl-sn-glycerol-3-phosphate acyltransferase
MSEPYRIPLRFRLSRPVLKAVFRLLFHILGRVEVKGKEFIPYGKPYVVAINHISLYDPPLAAAFWPEMLEIIGASDVFDRPGQGQLLRLYGVIPVHRGEYDRALLKRLISIIKAGYPLLIAPEGGRSHVTAMRRAYPGVAYIIEETGVPVVPVGLVGTTDDFWQRAKRGEKPHLEMRIGAPVTLPSITEKGAPRREARQRNADLVMQHLAGLLPEDYRGVYAETAIIPAETGQ